MNLRRSDILTWEGEIGRGPFLLWAAILFLIKYNLDRLLLGVVFGRFISAFSYFDRPLPWLEKLSPAQNPTEFAALMALSIPFLWIGIVLCLKRLRSAQLPLWLAILFVVPIVKWFLFVALSVVPGRTISAEQCVADESKEGRVTWLPRSRFGSAACAAGASTLLALAATALSTLALGNYGWALFVGVPFSMGFLSALIHGATNPRSLNESLAVAMLAIGLTGAALLGLAFEGIICLLMAWPLAAGIAVVGALAGHAVQSSRWNRRSARLCCIPLLAVPLMLGTENLRPGTPPLFKVVTAIELDAPPEQVWRHVVEFSSLPPPTEWIFKLGIAYPTSARIRGKGVGAVRHCNFSTGPFVEPITQWDEPRLLKFSVTENPEPMQEWTPYRDIDPPHLRGFMVSEEGQFLLEPLPGGRTRLEGTTWYHHTLWPATYWQLWSDGIIHTIHRRVLNHVKMLAEADG